MVDISTATKQAKTACSPANSRHAGFSRFCVAPMLDWTDRHARYFLRLISSHALLYTEMITTGALLHGETERHLHFDEAEHPLAIQLGGSDPEALARCAKLAESRGYDEVNLNVGCPSGRVQSGLFGACLMARPDLVAHCIKSMQDAVDIPVTVKCRIGIDDMDSYEYLSEFIRQIAGTGCNIFIIHARKAWLQGLSPKENREIPPLHYDRVYQLKKDFKDLSIVINGGIEDLEQATQHLGHVDGVMVGRAAYHNPYLLAEVDQQFYDDEKTVPNRHDILTQYIAYIERQLVQGVSLHHMSRHILGLYQGQIGARKFRRYISENAHKADSGVETILHAMHCVNPPA